MGKRLMQYYDYAKNNGGMVVQMRLAMKTGVASDKAESSPDSPELLAKFEQVAKELFGADAPKF